LKKNALFLGIRRKKANVSRGRSFSSSIDFQALMPRIIAGRLRGRRLVTPAGAATRPTAERVRQALFDMLAHASWAKGSLSGAQVLDAFAGSGALGLEAFSRGAARVDFIEHDRAACAAIAANIASLAPGTPLRLHRADALRPPPGQPCSLVLLDPPYGKNLVFPALAALREAGWIAPAALIVAELGHGEEIPPALGPPLAARGHGAAQILIWRG